MTTYEKSRCQIAGHCGHWAAAGRDDNTGTCCWCDDVNPATSQNQSNKQKGTQ